jgi:sugar phosphate isomerase/epimerase
MILGYNTNGMAHHDPLDAIQFLADTGYRAIGITIDHGWLSPRDAGSDVQLQQIKHALQQNEMISVIETGARFLLDPRNKHEPTLLNPDPVKSAQRIDFLKYCIDIAAELGSRCVSIWSGITPPGSNMHDSMETLVRILAPVLQHADDRNVDIGFEPEPGMLIDTTGRFERLMHLIDSPRLKMTMDIGHLYCMSEVPIAEYLDRWQDHIINVHIEDMVSDKHEHLMFGDGQIHFPPVIEALHQIGYQDGIYVELSRHSHAADRIVPSAFDFLNPIIEQTKHQG